VNGMDSIGYSLFNMPWKQKAKVAVFGIAYDATSEMAKGTLAFPAAIRLASYGIEWPAVDASDFGDILPSIPPKLMVKDVKEFMDDLWSQGFQKFLVLGGNHSITIPVVQFLAEKGLKRYVQFDAHADFRDSWSGTPYSFACTLRRVAEVADISMIGVRSIAGEEEEAFREVNAITGEEAPRRKKEVAKLVGNADYVSIDMDVFDIPHVTNPQPEHALNFTFVLDVLNGQKMGVDIVEGVPEKLYGDYVGTMGAILARKALQIMGGSDED